MKRMIFTVLVGLTFSILTTTAQFPLVNTIEKPDSENLAVSGSYLEGVGKVYYVSDRTNYPI